MKKNKAKVQLIELLLLLTIMYAIGFMAGGA